MQELRVKAKELLAAGTVKVVVGYGEGSDKYRARAVFVRKPEQADQLICDDRCKQNLAVYLTKPEIKALGKPAIVAKPPAMRTLLQLAAEKQLAPGDVVVLGVSTDGKLLDLPDFKAIEGYVATVPMEWESNPELARLEAMSADERWAYWRQQFSKCLKCYACRSSCPLCYCSRCTVDCNQPQWISTAPHALGNLEWHLMRAMHLAGRCIDCGTCADACPVGIPLNLLTQMLAREVKSDFGMVAGLNADAEYALSSFKPDDKEDFIR